MDAAGNVSVQYSDMIILDTQNYTITLEVAGGNSVSDPDSYMVSGNVQTRTLPEPTFPTYTVSYNSQ